MITTAKITPAVPVPIKDDIVTLTMTREVAEVLRQVCAKIGGHPDHTARGKMDTILNALDTAGVTKARFATRPEAGSIYFTE